MNYGSVCSGVEAASLAWKHLGWKPKFFAEVEPFPSAVLMERFGATRPLRPLEPEEAHDKKNHELRKNWKRQIVELSPEGTIPNFGDFTKIKETDYDGKIDLLVGGCPCQSYSVAGLRLGLADPRGNLTLEFIKLAYRTKARILVFENVPGILSSGDNGSDFAGFLSLLTGWEVKPPKKGWRNCGIVTNAPGCFGVAWRILDAQYTRVPEFPRAVPQRRRRLFLIGHLDNWQYPAKVLFDGEMRGGNTPPCREKRQETAGDTEKSINQAEPSKNRTGGNNLPLVMKTETPPCFHVNTPDELIPTEIPGSLMASPTGRMQSFVLNKDALQEQDEPISFIQNDAGGEQQGFWKGTAPILRKEANAAIAIAENIIGRQPMNGGNGLGVQEEIAYTQNATGVMGVACENDIKYTVNMMGGKSQVHVSDEDLSPTLATTHNESHAFMKSDFTIRKLLPLECERLMGFPDNHTQIPWKGKPAEECPDSPRYKACGNSMCVNVMMWIGERIAMVEKEKMQEGKEQ